MTSYGGVFPVFEIIDTQVHCRERRTLMTLLYIEYIIANVRYWSEDQPKIKDKSLPW